MLHQHSTRFRHILLIVVSAAFLAPYTTMAAENKSPQTSGDVAPVGFVDARCFTQDQCTSPEYGGSLERFLPGQGCPSGQGKCLAPEPDIELANPILGQKTVVGIRGYVFLGLKYLLTIVVLVTAVMFVWGGFRYIFGATLGDFTRAKEIMVNATIGMLLTFGAILLLRTLNPATTRFDALRIFLINKQEFSFATKCAQVPSRPGQVIKFADAGNPPGTVPFSADPKKFTLTGADTACAKSYYIQGTSGQTCRGMKCEKSTEQCISCGSKEAIGGIQIPECAQKKAQESACVNLKFGGTIEWKNWREPLYVALIPVCGDAQPPGNDPGRVEKNLPFISGFNSNIYTPGNSLTQPKEQGSVSFKIQFDESLLAQANAACPNKTPGHGMRGAVLGVVYHDTCTLADAARIFLRNSGSESSYFKGVDLAKCASSNDDALIVTKLDCGNTGNALYSGYANGGSAFGIGGSDVARHAPRVALYCGWVTKPGSGSFESNPPDSHIFDWNPGKQPYWTYEELLEVAKGASSVSCNFTLTSTNAPRNPGGGAVEGDQGLVAGCSYNFLKFQKDGVTKERFTITNQ